MTKEPSVWVPATTSRADIIMQISMPPVKIAIWPALSTASDT